MILLDKPYVSDLLKRTIKENQLPVVETEAVSEFELLQGTQFIKSEKAIEIAVNQKHPLIYTNSENAIGWIAKNLSHTDLPEKIDLFKDKFKFRELTRSIVPDFYFKRVSAGELPNIVIEEIPLPFIIKPTVGFFSMGVYPVRDYEQWPQTVASILEEMKKSKGIYPNEVLDATHFIIEEMIEGDEFAIDLYFNETGEAAILGIFQHIFASATDFSDRLYITSSQLIREKLYSFSEFAGNLNTLTKVKNFPLHIEVRISKKGEIIPIEANPMRFGGWCTTADLTSMAYGFNPYLYFINQEEPDWDDLLKDKNGRTFSVIVLNNSTGIEAKKIESFDYDSLLSGFQDPLAIRRTNYSKYPVFGFLFARTDDNSLNELYHILESDLVEYISLRK